MVKAILFDKNEAAYQSWLNGNPEGFVLNSFRNPSPNYLVLHRSECHTISEYRQNAGKPAFTGGRYVKICAGLPSSLLVWLKSVGLNKFSGYCSSCGTSALLLDEAAQVQTQLQEDVQKYLEDDVALAIALSKAPSKPGKSVVITQVFIRSAAVIAAVLKRAAGVCEGCKQDAPFKRKSNGAPYLEVHHKVMLSKDGDDTVQNAVALCPTCHRRSHFG